MRLLRLSLFLLLCATLAIAQQRKKIVLSGMNPAQREAFVNGGFNADFIPATREETIKVIAEADALIGSPTAEVIRAGRKLRWVQVLSAGVERYGFPELRDNPNIILTNGKMTAGPNIADHAMAMLLALTRELPKHFAAKSQHQWGIKGLNPIELRGKTAVIIGLGGIGMQIAQRCKGFDMTVIGVDPKDIPLNPAVNRIVTPNRLDTVLPEADVLFISAPDTAQSRGMVGPRQFELLKKGAYFIAVSRGRVYQMNALVQALDGQKLSGAGVDVTDPEPLPKSHPLWNFDNVIITPHIATMSDNWPSRLIALVKENVRRFVEGETLLNVVDKQKGY